MKKILTVALSVTLAFLMAFTAPVNAFAQAVQTKTYISEVKVGMGDRAKADLEAAGFTVLCDEKGNPVDLNQGAGGGAGSKGDKKVLLGYKTTTEVGEAITDLAVMNMNGGYDVQEYDALMEKYINAQIIPFIEGFLVTIDEYRENYNSTDEVNRARAQYICAALNKFTDDDCGGAPLGDLLLKKTKYEMGDEAYDALSEEEKKEHCDIVTLFAQADGQVMLSIYALLTRAADTSDDSWIERFSLMTYDDLLDSYDMAPTDAKNKAAKDFEDDAKTILKSWEEFRTFLLSADENAELINEIELPDLDAIQQKIDALDENATEDEIAQVGAELLVAQEMYSGYTELLYSVTTADFLDSFDYEDGTLYDFFTQPVGDVTNNIESLYTLAAALSPGQRAGIEFLSIAELVSSGNRDIEYSEDDLKEVKAASVYEGIDRAIYEKGGVALTWEARRENKAATDVNLAERGFLSTKTITCYAVAGASFIAAIGCAIYGRLAESARVSKLKVAQQNLDNFLNEGYENIASDVHYFNERVLIGYKPYGDIEENIELYSQQVMDRFIGDEQRLMEKAAPLKDEVAKLAAGTSTAQWMAVGFAAVTLIVSLYSLYSTWQDLKNFYKVDFTPIPHYMVDVLSITYEANGETYVKENHAAYYAAVKCNRTSSDGFGGKRYEMLGDCADLNGDVGQQWLALYACKNYKQMQPILADSLKVVIDSNDIPATYDNHGIHMFGKDSAFNLNSKLYDWNQSAKSVFVYFKVDETVTPEATTEGSGFTPGRIALLSVGSAGFGAIVTALAMTLFGKKKKEEEEPAAA